MWHESSKNFHCNIAEPNPLKVGVHYFTFFSNLAILNCLLRLLCVQKVQCIFRRKILHAMQHVQNCGKYVCIYFEVNQNLETQIRSQNYGLMECYPLMSDLIITKNNRDQDMQQTRTPAKIHQHRSIRLPFSVLTRSTLRTERFYRPGLG